MSTISLLPFFMYICADMVILECVFLYSNLMSCDLFVAIYVVLLAIYVVLLGLYCSSNDNRSYNICIIKIFHQLTKRGCTVYSTMTNL